MEKSGTMKKDYIYIITSEYVQHGITFNKKVRYIKEKDKADAVYEQTLSKMKADNEDMLSNKSSYAVRKANNKFNKYFYCYYKYQPELSNFSIEIHRENLE